MAAAGGVCGRTDIGGCFRRIRYVLDSWSGPGESPMIRTCGGEKTSGILIRRSVTSAANSNTLLILRKSPLHTSTEGTSGTLASMHAWHEQESVMQETEFRRRSSAANKSVTIGASTCTGARREQKSAYHYLARQCSLSAVPRRPPRLRSPFVSPRGQSIARHASLVAGPLSSPR